MARHVSGLSQCTVEHLLKNTDPLRQMCLFSTRVSVFKRIGFHFKFSMSPIVALHTSTTTVLVVDLHPVIASSIK